MGDKPFLSYEQLIIKLRDEKHMTIKSEDEHHAESLLKKYSYFSLVSGYKTLFKQQDGTYFSGTTIDDIWALYQFDDNLRDVFFHSIEIVEKHIKSLLSHAFVEEYGDDQGQYLTPLNYDSRNDYKREKEIKKLISTFSNAVTPPSDHKYIDHQWSKHKNVPLWASMKAITFGSVSKMFSLCLPKIQSGVSKEFADVSPEMLAGMLDMLTRVRNVCAHNERLYDFSVEKRRAIQDTPVHASLRIPRTPSGRYKLGKTDLFAALICFKYLLDDADFKRAVSGIDGALSLLFSRTKKIPPNKILSCMGFPENWTRM